AVHPPPKSRAWLPGATRNPPLFILSLLPSGLASTREVRDSTVRGELLFASCLFTGRRGLRGGGAGASGERRRGRRRVGGRCERAAEGRHGPALKTCQKGQLEKLPTMNGSKDPPKSYDFDLIIIGGGSGGLAAAKEAARFDKKVLVLDFVTPTPLGTRWGLGGTCVNVGCIPKKLMHQAALLGQALKDSRNYGWKVEDTVKHDWEKMTESVQNHIGSLNWGYRVALREKKVVYENAYGKFIGPHRIKVIVKLDSVFPCSFKTVFIGVSRKKPFPYCPGKTLVVGASYVALECAGFLAGIGLDVTVMVRSILLRGFDQDMANKIGEHMEEHGVKFIRQFVPIKVSLTFLGRGRQDGQRQTCEC
ncbi:Thioredoxin reductase 1, cytoplasmic, partial [Lemmus lemmus]